VEPALESPGDCRVKSCPSRLCFPGASGRWFRRPYGTRADVVAGYPALETPGYCQMSLRDKHSLACGTNTCLPPRSNLVSARIFQLVENALRTTRIGLTDAASPGGTGDSSPPVSLAGTHAANLSVSRRDT